MIGLMLELLGLLFLASGLLGLHFALLHGAFSETLTLSWNQVYAGFIMASLGVIIQIIGLVLYSSRPRSD